MRNPSPQIRGVLHRWASVLPLNENTPRISLGEGDTPLVRSATIERECGLDELWFKLESCNPTGSFKDRGMVMAVAKAMESGAEAIMCASTGNTSASAAAYAAHCGLDCFVLVPGGRVAIGTPRSSRQSPPRRTVRKRSVAAGGINLLGAPWARRVALMPAATSGCPSCSCTAASR